MVWFLPFAVELSKKHPFEIVGNKYSAEVCAMAGLTNITHDTEHTVLRPPAGAIVARIRRYGEKSYRQIFAEATGCEGDKAATWVALGIKPINVIPHTLVFDPPRASGLGSKTYTPNVAEFCKDLLAVSAQFEKISHIPHQPVLRNLFVIVANANAGFGQIGFLTALCNLFDKPFYAVRANGEPDDKFAERKRVVGL